jgi:hypothetical protein
VKFPPAAAADWKKLLAHTIADLMEHQRAAKPPQRVVFFWDEIPFMLSKIEKAVGPNAAMEVLDELRALRHTHTDLRMVFTGSIGLHHVLAQLKHAGHANDATNDMELRDVPTLHAGDAKRLARMLITGEGIPADDLDSVVTTVADSVDCHAFYIQNLVNRMKSAGTTASVPGVAALLDTCLTDAHDPWHLRHYYERLGTYYNDDSAMCLLVLDTLAVQTAPLPLAVLLNLVKHQRPDAGAEQIRGIVTLLAQDHYLHQDTDGRIRFRYPLIQRWWRLHRGLGS